MLLVQSYYFTVSVSCGIGQRLWTILSFGFGIGSKAKKLVSVVHYSQKFLKWHFFPCAWNLNSFVAKYLHFKCYECAIIIPFPYRISVSSKSRICVNCGQKGNFLKMYFHFCFLVFPYYVNII